MFDFDVVTGPAGLIVPDHRDTDPKAGQEEGSSARSAAGDDRQPGGKAVLNDGNGASR